MAERVQRSLLSAGSVWPQMVVTGPVLVPETALLAAADFTMGTAAGRPDERPPHGVSLASFRAGIYPVSNAEYDCFVRATGASPAQFLDMEGFGAPEVPVAGVSWFEAVAYCAWLAQETGTAFRLPTEAEREYAARGGLAGADWPWGDETPEGRRELANVSALARPHAPTEPCRNGFGLFCMAENLHEWCSDWYSSDYYSESPRQAPGGPRNGRRRASRGGSWRHQIKFNRVSARSSLDPAFQYNDYGFRVYARD